LKDAISYSGVFKNGLAEGDGVINFPSGSKLYSKFVENQKHGKGKLILPNEKGWFEGEFVYDVENVQKSKYSRRL